MFTTIEYKLIDEIAASKPPDRPDMLSATVGWPLA